MKSIYKDLGKLCIFWTSDLC